MSDLYHCKGPVLEAVLSRDLEHPDIVPTLQLQIRRGGELDEEGPQGKKHLRVWILQPYCNRGTLLDAIDRGWLRVRPTADSPPDVRAVLLTAQDIASALAYLHARGTLHGDLTGNNCLLDASPEDPRGFVAKAHACGAAGGGLLSKASDVYSWGVLCWEMWCSQHAWGACCNLAQIVYAKVVLRERLTLPPEGCPPDFKSLVERCMADDHCQRPAFDAILPALEGMLAGLAAPSGGG